MCIVVIGSFFISLYSVNSSTNKWRIANFGSALNTSKSANLKGLSYSLSQRVQQEDRFDSRESTLVKGLYRSIPTQRAEELLSEGVKDEYAVATAIKEYYDSTLKDSISMGSYTASDRALDVQDETGNQTYYDFTSYIDDNLDIHVGNLDDTIDLGGIGNNIILNLDSGDNVVNVDTSSINNFVIKSGTGVDAVNLSGSAVNYAYTDNSDTTLTLTNLDSGAAVTIDKDIDNVNFSDGSTLEFDGSVVTLETSSSSESFVITDDNTAYNISMNGGNDTLAIQGSNNTINVALDNKIDNLVSVGGENNIVNIDLNSGQDTIFVQAALNNQVTINGGDYSDAVVLQGDATDWTQAGNLFTHNTLGASVTVANVEQVVFGDVIDDADGAKSSYDYTASSNMGGIINLNDNDDSVNLGGDHNYIEVLMNSGDNVVNVDTANYNKFFVRGGTGNDTLNFTGNVEDYTFQNNDNGTLSVTNVDSGAKTVLDSNIENINFADSTSMTFDGSKMILNSSNSTDTINITGENNNIELYTNSGDDNITIDGKNNKVLLLTGNGDDNIFVAAGSNNDITVEGRDGVDTLTLQGVAADWVFSGSAVGKTYYDNILTGTRVTLLTGIDNVVFDNAIVVNDSLGVPNNYDLTGYNNSTIVVNSGEGNDTIALDGNNNNATVNLTSGNNSVNIDDTGNSTYVINGGTGVDTVTLSGNVADYTSVTNPDDTVTYTNTVTGAAITLNPDDIESLIAQDGVIFGAITINGTPDVDNIDVSGYNDSIINVNTYQGNDTVTAGGFDNFVTIDAGEGDDVVNIDDTGVNSIFNVAGGDGVDTVNMSGDLSDYTFINNGDNTLTLLNNTSGSETTIDTTVENLVLNDGSQIDFDGATITITDAPGNSNTINLDSSVNTTFVVNTGNQNDTVNVGGLENITTVNLGSGENIVNVDDSIYNTVTINGGTGDDTVNLSGTLTEYSIIDNGDETLTLTNNQSGATITVNSNVEGIVLGDGTQIGYDGNIITITDADNNDSNIDLTDYNVSRFVVNTGDQNDVVNLGGIENDTTVNLGSGDNVVNIVDSNYNTVVINGGTGTDTVTLSGNIADYTSIVNPDGTTTFTNSISGATTTLDLSLVENVNAADGSLIGPTVINGTVGADNIDLTAYNDAELIVNANSGNDTVSLGGSNNNVIVNLDSGDNVVNVDDASANTFVINGGTGVDTVNMDGNITDYTFIDNGDETLTLVNNLSGSETTVDIYVENVVMSDGVSVKYDNGFVTIVDAPANPINLDLSDNSSVKFHITASDMDDTITLGGDSNYTVLNLNSGNNTVNIDDTNNNTAFINGGTGIDTVNLGGTLSDYSITNNGDGVIVLNNNISGATTTIDSSVENIILGDGTQIAFEGRTNIITDADNNDSVIDLTDYSVSRFVVNTGNEYDVVNLGGMENIVTVNLGSGGSIVNIDDSNFNTFVVNGGYNLDRVNFSGNFSDYRIVDNGDETLTLTNSISGATTTLGTDLEYIDFGDGTELMHYGSTFNITEGSNSSSTFDFTDYNASDINLFMGDQNDTVNLGGEGNDVTVTLSSGDNIVNFDDSTFNIVRINGGTGEDTVNLSGDLSDYSIVDNGDSTLTLTNNHSGAMTTINSSVENIVMADASVINFDGSVVTITDALGNATNLDLSSYSNSIYVVNASDRDDTISLGGDGNDFTVNLDSGDNTVNIDDTELSRFVINGGSGTDLVTLSGAYEDYTIELGGSSYAISNNSSGSRILIDSSVDFIQFTDGTYEYDQLLPLS